MAFDWPGQSSGTNALPTSCLYNRLPKYKSIEKIDHLYCPVFTRCIDKIARRVRIRMTLPLSLFLSLSSTSVLSFLEMIRRAILLQYMVIKSRDLFAIARAGLIILLLVLEHWEPELMPIAISLPDVKINPTNLTSVSNRWNHGRFIVIDATCFDENHYFARRARCITVLI